MSNFETEKKWITHGTGSEAAELLWGLVYETHNNQGVSPNAKVVRQFHLPQSSEFDSWNLEVGLQTDGNDRKLVFRQIEGGDESVDIPLDVEQYGLVVDYLLDDNSKQAVSLSDKVYTRVKFDDENGGLTTLRARMNEKDGQTKTIFSLKKKTMIDGNPETIEIEQPISEDEYAFLNSKFASRTLDQLRFQLDGLHHRLQLTGDYLKGREDSHFYVELEAKNDDGGTLLGRGLGLDGLLEEEFGIEVAVPLDEFDDVTKDFTYSKLRWSRENQPPISRIS